MAVTISFPPNPEADVDFYRVYRSTNKTPAGPYTEVGQVNHVPAVPSLSYLDVNGALDDLYKLSAVNLEGIEGLATGVITPRSTGNLTRVYDTLFNASMRPLIGVKVMAKLTGTGQAKFNGTIIPKVVETISDANGIWYLDLYPNSVLDPAGTTYLLTVQGVNPPKEVAVPVALTVSYSDLVTLP